MKNYKVSLFLCLTFLIPSAISAKPLNQRIGQKAHYPPGLSQVSRYSYVRKEVAFNSDEGSAAPQKKAKARKGHGEISGKVTDAQTNEALIGATVMLKGTSLGAATNLHGEYTIEGIPAGTYTIRVTYVGYTTRNVKVEMHAKEKLVENIKLRGVGVVGKKVVVTVQAQGQNAAINQELSSNKIVNVVSAARIRQLPDQNAAGSLGRLPGVYLLRQGGQGYEVSIDGLQPKYNRVEVDGVEMAATSSSDRAVNMSMISSNMLSGIEVFKTVTPDMNADVLGGVVNFQIREARQTSSGAPEIQLSTQGGYERLRSQFGDYNFSATVGDRFLNQRLGILVQGVVDRENLSSDALGAGYSLASKNPGYNPLLLDNLTLTFNPRITRRYDGTVNMDYRLPGGKIDFMNFFSQGNTTTQTLSQEYSLASNQIFENASYSPAQLDVMTNLLDLKENVLSFDVDAKVSHSLSENISRGNWGVTFQEYPANLATVSQSSPPVVIAQAASAKVTPKTMDLLNMNTSNNITMQRNIAGSIDISRNITVSDVVSGIVKFGGAYRYTHRSYSTNDAGGGLFFDSKSTVFGAIINANPWMEQTPYNLNPSKSYTLPITVFESPSYDFGNFLNGSYAPGIPMDMGFLSQIVDFVRQGAEKAGWQPWGYSPDPYGDIANNYSGNEYESAAYAMATVNIGSQLTLIGGARYQGLTTAYRTARIADATLTNVYYPSPYPARDTTIDVYHGYLLPDVSLTYKPVSWLIARLSYTNTLAYPDFTSIIPTIDLFPNSRSVTWNNFALQPAHSHNYNVQLSFYNNAIGLLTVGGFLKRIDDMIFPQSNYISNTSLYPGLDSTQLDYHVTTDFNNPNRVDDYGAEFDWETHLWYLPGVLSGLVFNINYTHIFSSAKYPFTVTEPGVFPTYIPVHVDTFYTDRLIYQPDNVVNLSAGYDYRGFSVVVSMIYQSNVSTGTDQYPELRPAKLSYLRWDLTAKQSLPWPGLVVYLNLVDLNNASDTYVVQGTGFPTSESDYGSVAQLGLRWNLQ